MRTLAAWLIVFSALTGCSSPERAWNAAAKQDTVQAYQAFLKKHPASELAPGARERMEILAWEDAFRASTVEGYEKFLADFPSSKNGPYAKAALDMIRSLAVTVAGHGVAPSASCGGAEAIVLDVAAQRAGASATIHSRIIQAQQKTGDWAPLQRFLILQHTNAQLEDVAIGGCFEDPGLLNFGGASTDIKTSANNWAFSPDATYFKTGLSTMHAFIVFGSSAIVGFRDGTLFGRGDNATKRSEESVTVQFQAGGTMRTMLLFRSQNTGSPAAATPQITSIRAFGRVFELRPAQQKSE
jgi:hypothetical protein